MSLVYSHYILTNKTIFGGGDSKKKKKKEKKLLVKPYDSLCVCKMAE